MTYQKTYFIILTPYVGSQFWRGGVFHCRRKRTWTRSQTQQAQYNEFGREEGLRTGPLWGLRQRSGRIIGGQDRQQRSWGKGQGPSSGLVRRRILLLFFWYSTNRTSWCLPNCRPPSLREISLVIYILMLPSSWPSICRLHRSPLECLSHPAFPSTCCELQWAAWHYLGVIPSLMRSDCQLRAFNAEVTGSCIIALSPCSHNCSSTLVPSFGDDGEGCDGWRIVLSSQNTSCRGHDVPRQFLLVAVGLPLSSLDVFLLGWALGLIIWNGPGRLDPLAPHPILQFTIHHIFYFSILYIKIIYIKILKKTINFFKKIQNKNPPPYTNISTEL